jgi:23S rRNA U2552 (ribose-2'-O)-methylase RlmE/FtsJ
MEIDDKDQLLRRAWWWSTSARARRLVAGGGRAGRQRRPVLALDLLDMAPVAGVEFLQGDFARTPCWRN